MKFNVAQKGNNLSPFSDLKSALTYFKKGKIKEDSQH